MTVPCATIERAVALAMNGDTVMVATGFYECSNISVQNSSLHFLAYGEGAVIMDCSWQSQAFYFENCNVHMDGFSIRRGMGPLGGAVAISINDRTINSGYA